VPYYVERRYEYPRFVCYDCHAYASYDEWNPYERACSRFRVVIYDDPRYYPHRYNRGRTIVAERPRQLAPRYVFRDVDPGAGYVTRLQRRRSEAEARTSDDVGGRGSVPAPGVQALGRRSVREQEPSLRRPAIEKRRRRDVDSIPDGLRPAPERRFGPERRPAKPPRSTGEPELRRRRP
jgi:hypothetical protein